MGGSKYKKWYDSIINNAKTRSHIVSGENHHIIPKFDGGDNSKENIVLLTYKEHYVCHLLLTKFAKNKVKAKFAFFCGMKMKVSNGKRYNSQLFKLFREKSQSFLSGENNPFFGKTHSKETKKRLSILNKAAVEREEYSNPFKGKKHTKETKEKLSKKAKANSSKKDYINPFLGKAHTEETKKTMSDKAKKRCDSDNWTPPFLGKKITKEMILKMNKTKEKNGNIPIGGKNPNAKILKYNNVIYDCMKALQEETGLSRFIVRKKIKNKEIEVINKKNKENLCL